MLVYYVSGVFHVLPLVVRLTSKASLVMSLVIVDSWSADAKQSSTSK